MKVSWVTNQEESSTLDLTHSMLAIAMWVLIQGPGNVMLIALIKFEKYGGDPLKRRISDQLFTTASGVIILCNLSVVNITMVKGFLVDNAGLMAGLILTTVRVTAAVLAVMVVIETTVLRYLTEFMWKRVPPINDAFIVSFLTKMNILTGFLVSMARHATGEGKDVIYRLQGIDNALVPPPELKLKIPFKMMLVAITLMILLALRKHFCKIQKKLKKSKISPIILEPSNALHQNSFNTQANNPELMNHKITVISVMMTIAIACPTILAYFYLSNSGRFDLNQSIILIDLLPHFALSFVAPLLIFCSNSSLRKFTSQLICNRI